MTPFAGPAHKVHFTQFAKVFCDREKTNGSDDRPDVINKHVENSTRYLISRRDVLQVCIRAFRIGFKTIFHQNIKNESPNSIPIFYLRRTQPPIWSIHRPILKTIETLSRCGYDPRPSEPP